MLHSMKTLAIPLGILALMGCARVASAQDAAAPKPYVVSDQTATTGPNRPLLHSGIWILGLSYVPAVVVAATSSRYGDKNLYIPVVGPWLDLATRGSCPTNVACNNETVNKVLLVVDGIFQGFGALDIVSAFVFPETRTVTVRSSERGADHRSSASIRFLPARVGGNAYGLAAVGAF